MMINNENFVIYSLLAVSRVNKYATLFMSFFHLDIFFCNLWFLKIEFEQTRYKKLVLVCVKLTLINIA